MLVKLCNNKTGRNLKAFLWLADIHSVCLMIWRWASQNLYTLFLWKNSLLLLWTAFEFYRASKRALYVVLRVICLKHKEFWHSWLLYKVVYTHAFHDTFWCKNLSGAFTCSTSESSILILSLNVCSVCKEHVFEVNVSTWKRIGSFESVRSSPIRNYNLPFHF